MVMSMYLSVMARILLCSRDAFSQVIHFYFIHTVVQRSESLEWLHSDHGFLENCHVLVTRHGVWIANWIYGTLVTCNYK
jgi:hypothetical protein